ncbi:MAG: hypothetical protein IJV67_00475 [Clostridia bacterium]|nr:hypothetical protein [Clostridia bacterium]
MRKNTVAVLDVGSSKLQLITGERGLNKTFLIKSSAETGYAGFSEASFFEPEKLSAAVQSVVKKAEAGLRNSIDELYVGVPGEFIASYCKFFNISLHKKKKITQEDVDKLYETAFTAKTQKYKLIARSAVNFILSGNRKVTSPKGQISDTLGGYLTFYLCDNNFLKIFDGALKSVGIKKIEYFPTSLAEVLYLFEPYERDMGGILLDIGYLTGTFSYFSGDGILFEKSFSLGGGYITAKLLNDFNLPFSAAEKLKRMVNVSYNPYEDARYEWEDGLKAYSVPVSKVNASVKEVLDALAEQVALCIEEGVVNYSGNVVISLTGGGISYIRGAKEYLAGRLGAIIQTVTPNLPIYNKPINSSSFSLMDIALKNK